MTEQELEKIKQVQLDIMDEIHRICTKHNITYYMIGGTLLGAVRHKGFIPWDVDIDIAMPRSEYERFKSVCASELDENYCYLDYMSIKNYTSPHALICDKNSRLYKKYDHVNPSAGGYGIYVDIFPLDNAPDDEGLRKKQARRLKRIRKFKQYRIPYSYSFKKTKRLAHYCVSALLSWVSVRRINRYQQKLMKKYQNEQTQCICSMGSQYAYKKQCMPRDTYGTPVLLEFEGRGYLSPQKYKEYLTRLYGDYMQLPPVEQRQANLEQYSSVEFL